MINRIEKLNLEILRIEKVKLDFFTKEDWYGFAGAEDFPNGSLPLISYNVPAKRSVGIGYNTVIVILDGKGVEISGQSKITDKTVAYTKEKKFSNPMMARSWFYNVINIPVNLTQLKELGFKKYRIS